MKKIKFISFLFITCLFSFVILEIGVRIFFFLSNNDIKAFKKYPGRYKESHFTGYDLQKNFELNHKSKKEKIRTGFYVSVALLCMALNLKIRGQKCYRTY